MPKAFFAIGALVAALWAAHPMAAQEPAGSIELIARVAPTAGRPEPVRQFTFYLLRKSYAEIVNEAEAADPLPTREQFLAGLKFSPEMKAWMKTNDILDLASPDVERFLTVDNILNIPEFLDAYQRANSGGVSPGLPKPKYTEADEAAKSERYQKLHKEYFAALKKFIQSNPQTVGGMETFLDAINPAHQWNQVNADHRRVVERRAPALAQTQYLAATAESDLEGRASLRGLAPGTYWLSTLNMVAASGDARLRWDVRVTVESGKTARVELSNLNAADSLSSAR